MPLLLHRSEQSLLTGLKIQIGDTGIEIHRAHGVPSTSLAWRTGAILMIRTSSNPSAHHAFAALIDKILREFQINRSLCDPTKFHQRHFDFGVAQALPPVRPEGVHSKSAKRVAMSSNWVECVAR
jgi:hypothetical protein